MKVSLDDGKTWLEVESVRVSQNIPDPTENELEVNLNFNFTHEGLISDVWIDNVVQGTSSETYLEIGDKLVQ